jgi:F0F1-type ATP synthase delta subunit
VDKKRLGLIKDITTEFETIINEFTDTQLATVTSLGRMALDSLT